MSDEAIEPTEILTSRTKTEKVITSHFKPSIRVLARLTDYALFSIAASLVSAPLLKLFNYNYFFIPIRFFLWIPIEAILLTLWGTTPGKFLLNTTLKLPGNKKFDLQTGLRRSFSVWLKGMGMGLPIIQVITLTNAYLRLKQFGMTSWDQQEKITVTHHPINRLRFITASLIIIAGIFFTKATFW